MRVLIVGGSGYLGQFLVEAMLKDEAVSWVGYTYHSKPLSGHLPDGRCMGYPVDVATGEGAEVGGSRRHPCHSSIDRRHMHDAVSPSLTCVKRLDEKRRAICK